MRLLAAALMFAFAACSPPFAPAEPPPQAAIAGGADRIVAPAFTLQSRALTGQWSFDRSCGVYDLVFSADGAANYYNYTDQSHVVSYAGRWAVDHNRIVMTMRRLGGDDAPSGAALTYSFGVSDPVTDDLIGRFGQAESDTRNIAAKRCLEEDRE